MQGNPSPKKNDTTFHEQSNEFIQQIFMEDLFDTSYQARFQANISE